jgi:cytochrome c oxidase assembly protein subunit 11
MSALRKAHLYIAAKLCVLVIGMFGFGYLMVPIYNVLCDITGLNGKPAMEAAQLIDTEMAQEEQREITVEFVSVINSGAAWTFTPTQRTMKVIPGKSYQTSYQVTNLAQRAAVGQAVPSVAPSSAAKYLNKIECFCFNRQDFEAGSTKDLPLVFFVEPDLPRSIDTITLSYTYFDIEEAGKAVPNS